MRISKAFQGIYSAIATGKGRRSKRAMVAAGAIALVNATAGLGHAVDTNLQRFELPEIGEEIALAEERFANLENRDRILEQLAALKTVGDAIETRKYKMRFLFQLGQVYGKLGATEQALAMLRGAERLAESSDELVAIANVYRRMEEQDRALATLAKAEAVLDTAVDPLAYQWLAIAQAYRVLGAREEAINALAQSEATAIALGDKQGQPPVTFRLQWVAQQYGELEEWERARETLAVSMTAAQETKDLTLRVSALLSTGKLAAETRNGDQMVEALQMAQTQTAAIEPSERRAFYLITAAQVYQEFPQFSEEGNRLRTALTLAQAAVDQVDEPWLQSNSQLQMAQIYDQLGQGDRALATLEKAEQAVNRSEEARVQTYAILPIAERYREMGEMDRAIAALEKSRAAVDKVEGAPAKVNALLSIARAYEELEKSDRVVEAMDAVSAVVKAIESPNERVFQALNVARIYDTLEQRDQALATMDIAQKAVEELADDAPSKVSALSQMAHTYKQMKASDRAIESLAMAQSLMQRQGDAYSRTFFMYGASQIYVELGEKDQALSVMEKAQSTSETIEDRWAKVNALANVAQGYGRLGDSDRAFEVLATAQNTGSLIEGDQSKGSALAAIAYAYLGVEPSK
ncbi:MAG: hypothetical protein AAF889_06840 [Cyanobacteria bacterium P01_D01_bin.73]